MTLLSLPFHEFEAKQPSGRALPLTGLFPSLIVSLVYAKRAVFPSAP